MYAQNFTFRNPLLPVGPDPWVIYHDNYYYYMNTTAKNLTIWKTKDITDLNGAERKSFGLRPLVVRIPTTFGRLNCIS